MASLGDEMKPNQGKEVVPGALPDRKSSIVLDEYDPETPDIDLVAEKKLVRKLDLHIVPMAMLLYLLVRCPTFLTAKPGTDMPRRSPSSIASTSAMRASMASPKTSP